MDSPGVKVRERFQERFDGDPILVRSPGRVNLIGEHTDYNDGFVLPAAIDKVIMVAIAPNGRGKVNLVSIDMDDLYSCQLSDPIEKSGKGWPDYILGAVDQLREAGYPVGGFDCVFGGNIPIGAGLSSSAALEGGILYGLSSIFGLGIPTLEMARMGQRTENEFVGVQCGIMDQFVNIHGEDGHVLKLDCRSLDYELYPFDEDDLHIVLCDTGIRRELASSEYNIRRRQCEQGVEILKDFDPEVSSLRDVSLDLLETHGSRLPDPIYRRCLYVLQENDRVEKCCRALLDDDIEAFGRNMYHSHAGLRDLFEVSCRELDLLVDQARESDGVIGARMMGGGFGGCTINLVKESALDRFSRHIRDAYSDEIGREVEIYLTRIGAGTRTVPGRGEEGKT
ncbi:MAG: galactokinase [Balneolaceae bacterium]|nr:galactokinase [Balneolaceae bacterium]